MPSKDTTNVTFLPWGRGIGVALVDGAMILRVPVGKDAVNQAGMSKSGKNKLLATSGGLIPVPDAPFGIRVNLSVTADPAATK